MTTPMKHIIAIVALSIMATLLIIFAIIFAPDKQADATPRSYLIQEPDKYGVACYSRTVDTISCLKVITDKE